MVKFSTVIANLWRGKMEDFKSLLVRAGISKAQLARDLGLNPRSISHWKSNPPQYAIAYLKLLINYRKLTL